MAPVSLALVWHQHQPYYPDDVAGENPMPWVRLHATKDYLGMALHLEEVPEFSCTINLVPSLLAQLEAYVERRQRHSSRRCRAGRPTAWSDDDACYLLDNFFMANPDTMIRPHPRYHELYLMRSSWDSSAKQALHRFRPRDLRDLQVWSNLAWIHPLLFEKDPELAEFKDKGRHYTEEEKQWFLDKQRELVARVIPLHRELAARGQIELTTTPYYHPILPLLLDKTLAREAMPDVTLAGLPRRLPRRRRPRTSAAPSRATLGLFGERPRGMWPSEGSVCQAMIPLLAEHGIEWIATDEEILGCSTGRQGRSRQPGPRPPSRAALPRLEGARGRARAGDRLPRPFDVGPGRVPLPAQSRARSRPPTSSARCAAIGDACRHNPATLVPVILDGENCWEYYPDGGVSFLRSLYQGAARDPRIRPGQGRRVPPRASRRPTPCTGSSPGAGSATTSPSGSAIPKTTGAGTRCTPPASSWSTKNAPAGTIRPRWREPGTRSTSPRAPTGSGGTATTIRAPWTACSTTCSASTCAMSTRCLGCDPPGSLFTPISRAGGHRPLHDQPISFLERQGRRPRDLLRVDRRGALRLRQRSRDDDPGGAGLASNASGSASTPSGCWSGSTPRAGRRASGWPRPIGCASASSTRRNARSW